MKNISKCCFWLKSVTYIIHSAFSSLSRYLGQADFSIIRQFISQQYASSGRRKDNTPKSSQISWGIVKTTVTLHNNEWDLEALEENHTSTLTFLNQPLAIQFPNYVSDVGVVKAFSLSWINVYPSMHIFCFYSVSDNIVSVHLFLLPFLQAQLEGADKPWKTRFGLFHKS